MTLLSVANRCIYLKFVSIGLFHVLHVDDILLVRSDIVYFKKPNFSYWRILKIEDLGKVSFISVIEIHHDGSRGILSLYAEAIYI